MPTAQTGGAEFPLMANLLQLMMGPQSDAPTVPTAPGTAGTTPSAPTAGGTNAPRGRQANSADVLRALDWGDLTKGQGGSEGGRGVGFGNESGGQPGSAGSGTAKSAADALMGFAMGLGPLGIAGSIMGKVGSIAANPNSFSALLSGDLAGFLGVGSPAGPLGQQMEKNIDVNPAAYGFGMDPGSLSSIDATSKAAASAVQTGDPSYGGATAGTGSSPGPGGEVGANPGGTPGLGTGDAPGGAPGGVRGGGDTGGGSDGGGGGDVCFAEDTPILMADGTTKPIRDIRVGDFVASFVELGPIVPAEVTAISTNGEWRATLDIDGRKVTPRHRFMTPVREWLRAERFVVGTVLVKADGSEHQVVSVGDGGMCRVFNFEVKDTHTYIAGGLRVHNSKAKGGAVTGPTPKEKNKDNVEITAQGGEHVMSRAAVQMVGRKKLDQINQIAELREKALEFVKMAQKLQKGNLKAA